ncbi:MAG TPA: class I SAM-dependent methyltransferase [Verrucomicrobiae bacterium]|nr:class I SAM-dependent methyltransferase [Verrucomicrobiae bacterium]
MSDASARCRFCECLIPEPVLDLGRMPLANSYLETQDGKDPAFNLRIYFCPVCNLVQLADYEDAGSIFNNHYAYFSSYSESWLRHAKDYVDKVTAAFGLNESSQVLEVASNDGYLLQYFVEKNIPVLGIEPSGNCAEVAVKKGVPTWVQFFNTETARELVEKKLQPDLIIGNNVLAHVPQLNDFVEGLKVALKPGGIITIEFPHLLKLMENNQFDTIYHEHFSYFTLAVVERIFARHLLTIFDVEELKTHGGSLRIYARHRENTALPVTDRVRDLKQREHAAELHKRETYERFARRVMSVKEKLLGFFEEARQKNLRVAGYGAPAKANTLLNFCGLSSKDLPYTVDLSPHKQGRYLPGSRIPICAPDKIYESRPDYVLIFPWNLRDEIEKQMQDIRQWGGRFVVPIPEVEVW